VAENAGSIEAHYAMNEFVAALLVADEAPLQYFDGFHDRHEGRIAMSPPPMSLPTLEIEPSRPASAAGTHAGCGWHAEVEGRPVCIAATPGGYAVWSATASRFYVWSAARRLLRDLWLDARLRRSPLAFVHASTVDDGQNLVLFVGDKRAGKTTLMLDAALHHGWRVVSNDTLVVFEGEQGYAVTGVPTYAGIRRDVADRFGSLLRARIQDDPANLGSYTHWQTSPVPAGREDKLYLSYGALSQPAFPAIPLSQRTVTVVAVGFAGKTERARLRRQDEDLLTFLDANRKPFRFSLDVVARPPMPVCTDPLCLRQLAQGARFAVYRHDGDSSPVLDMVTSDTPPAPVPIGHLSGKP
jgi:hypothetical protein